MAELDSIKFHQKSVVDFGRRRNWRKFHSPKNLSMALAVEASELLEHFQWLTEKESRNIDAAKQQQVEQELADIFMYTLLLSEELGVDLGEACDRKRRSNEDRFLEIPKVEN